MGERCLEQGPTLKTVMELDLLSVGEVYVSKSSSANSSDMLSKQQPGQGSV